MKRPVLVFDVNETLLDVKAMRPAFEATFGDATLMGDWFSMLLRYSLEVSVTGDYRSFDELAEAALAVAARRQGHDPTPDDVTSVIATMSNLPAHPDVAQGLADLSEAGFSLITLTNSRTEVVGAQLAFAGIAEHFDATLSVESVRAFKPAPATYEFAANTVDRPIDELLLIAAHDWDVNGALLAGAGAAFVERPGATRAPHNQIPAMVGPDLISVAAQLIDTYPNS